MNLLEIKMKDPIVEEVRMARLAHAEKFEHDLDAIYEDLKKIEIACKHRIVSFSPSFFNDDMKLKNQSA
jgi:hypothetical protein